MHSPLRFPRTGLLLLLGATAWGTPIPIGTVSYVPDSPVVGVYSLYLTNLTGPACDGLSVFVCTPMLIQGTVEAQYIHPVDGLSTASALYDPTLPGFSPFDPVLVNAHPLLSIGFTGSLAPTTLILWDASIHLVQSSILGTADLTVPGVDFLILDALPAPAAPLVPEPGTMLLAGAGVALVWVARRRAR